MPKYIGLTIGPIVKTIQNSKETYQLWGSSYIFSYLMKKIILKLNGSNILEKVIVPYSGDIDSEKLGAGLYPDRLIFKPKQNLEFSKIKEELESIFEEILNEISNGIKDSFDKKEKLVPKDEILKNLKEYIQIYYAEKEIGSEENIIIGMSPILDMLELNEKISPNFNKNYLLEFLKNENIKESFLVEDAFGKLKKIPNTGQIASFGGKNSKKKYSRYMAVVYSDGDGISKIIKKITSENDYDEFSKKLHEYSKGTVSEVRTYGGHLIYSGGDDLLFFAPVANGGETIFDLINRLSEKFENIFKNESEKPTLSFGVAIGYHKHPLYELRSESQNQLFGKAKRFNFKYFKPEDTSEKNAVSFKLMKHSGQTVETTLQKSTKTYKIFSELLKTYAKVSVSEKEGSNEKMLKSVTQKIRTDGILIEKVLGGKRSLKDYFENNFNEDIYKKEDVKEYLQKIRELIEVSYHEYGPEYRDISFSAIKFLAFLNESPSETEKIKDMEIEYEGK